jgi:hypothetical protein
MLSFDEIYPALCQWMMGHGWIDIGMIDGRSSMIRVLDQGGVIWETEASYPSLADAFEAAELAVVQWLREPPGSEDRERRDPSWPVALPSPRPVS